MKVTTPNRIDTVWIVVGYRITRNSKPFEHKTFALACAEAERLAGLNPGIWFNVYKWKKGFKQEKVKVLAEAVLSDDVVAVEA